MFQLGITLLPALVIVVSMGLIFRSVTAPPVVQDTSGLQAMGFAADADYTDQAFTGLAEPPPVETGLQEPPAGGDVATVPVKKPRAAGAADAKKTDTEAATPDVAQRVDAPLSFWIVLVICVVALLVFYATFNFARLEIFKMLLSSFFPLALLILAVLGSIVFGFATPSEAAAAGALGGLLLAAAYGQFNYPVVRDSVFLTAKTSAMVCWLFVGASIFSASFALLGGQEIIERWVTSLGLTPIEFLLLSQVIIFILGWPLEWTEIIVIFMPIFVPLLPQYGVDPLFFGLLVALNLQTAFLSPPVAMAAFYLKGVSPPHVTLNQIFGGMLPFMGLQVVAIFAAVCLSADRHVAA